MLSWLTTKIKSLFNPKVELTEEELINQIEQETEPFVLFYLNPDGSINIDMSDKTDDKFIEMLLNINDGNFENYMFEFMPEGVKNKYMLGKRLMEESPVIQPFQAFEKRLTE